MKRLILLTASTVAFMTLALPETTWAQPTGNRRRSASMKKVKRELSPPVRRLPLLNQKAITLVKPGYPAIAKLGHAAGTVIVEVLIDEEGKVITARAISGNPLLMSVSVAAAKDSLFHPTLIDGVPVRVTGVIQYNFLACGANGAGGGEVPK